MSRLHRNSVHLKKLIKQNCSKLINDSLNTDWKEWLEFINNFFNSYTVATILHNKPNNDLRPYLPVLIRNVQIWGLLDSGSAVTLLGNNAHYSIINQGFNMCYDEKITITAAGGQVLECLGYINIPFSFENREVVLKTFVVPEVQTPLILGIDFWKRFHICPKYINTIEYKTEHLNTNPTDADGPIQICSYSNLNESQRLNIDNLVEEFKDISSERKGLGCTSLVYHSIDTGETKPIRQRYYRMSPVKKKILCEQVDEMLSLDVIQPCESSWSSPVLVVNKKNGQPRICLDSRKLNSVTKRDAYSLPYVSEILDNLRDAKFITSIDLSKAFWQILISENDREKTAFYVPGRGTFCFKRMAFGLTNAPATQQRLVDLLFASFELKVFAYLDDIIIISNTFDEHVCLLSRVLEKLKEANLTINFEKSQFFRSRLKYLGYVIDDQGLRTDPDKVKAILEYPTPSSKKDVKRFLGTATWYRRFVHNFSTIAAPLNKLTSTRKGAPKFFWSSEADKSFITLKKCLVSAPVLRCPDYNLPFQVHTDASNCGVGAMLTQIVDGKEHPVAYMSKTLNAPEKNYSITERETLAVIVALEHWRCYLENGQPFVVYTDHSALKWFLSLSNPSGRLARWGIRLSSFNFIVKHRRGTDNVIPDALSRALPLSAISTSESYLTTNDKWYLDIYNGCINNPNKFKNFLVRDDKLFRCSKNKCPLTTEFSWKEVVPLELRENIIRENHAEPTAGHLGIHKTYYKLALQYFWPGMHSDVVSFISKCDTCLSYKVPTHNVLGEMGRPKQCSRPFQVLSIDFIGPLPVSRKQNCYILVVTCCFSKYCLAFPVRRATAAITVKHLEDSVFLIHGVPQTVYMDNGSQFISKEMNDFLNKYNVPNIFLTPKYTPQVNLVERYNKTIITCLSTFVEDDQRSWDVLLPKVLHAMNNSVNEVTGYTPSFLVYGRELVSCGSHYIDNDLGNEIVLVPRDKYAENIGYLANIFDKVQSSLWHHYQQNSKRYNLRRKFIEFNEGDIIFKRTYYLSDKDKHFNKKLAPKFIKCRITKKRSPLVYELEDMYGKSLGPWHIKDFKLTK